MEGVCIFNNRIYHVKTFTPMDVLRVILAQKHFSSTVFHHNSI